MHSTVEPVLFQSSEKTTNEKQFSLKTKKCYKKKSGVSFLFC